MANDLLYYLYKELIPSSARTYGESLGKAITGQTEIPITEKNYSPEELALLKDLVQKSYDKKMENFTDPKKREGMIKWHDEQIGRLKYDQSHGWAMAKEEYEKQLKSLENAKQQYVEASKGKLPSDFMFDYGDYGPEAYKSKEEERLTADFGKASPLNLRNTFGKFRYKIDPETKKINIYDTYDFSNPSRQENVDKYAGMGMAEKAMESARAFVGGDRAALGEAYLGNKGVPVSIGLDIDQALLDKYKR
jgi:hypothetical protein